MKIAIIGTGAVGKTIASKLVELNHDITMGTRNVSEKVASREKDIYGNPPFNEWFKANNKVKLKSFAEAAAFGDIVINAASGGNGLGQRAWPGEPQPVVFRSLRQRGSRGERFAPRHMF